MQAEKAINSMRPELINKWDWYVLTRFVSFRFARDHPEYNWDKSLLWEKNDIEVGDFTDMISKTSFGSGIIKNKNIRILDTWRYLDLRIDRNPQKYDGGANLKYTTISNKPLSAEFIAISGVSMKALETTDDLDNILVRPDWCKKYLSYILENTNLTPAHFSELKKYMPFLDPIIMAIHVPIFLNVRNFTYPEIMQIKNDYPRIEFTHIHDSTYLEPEQMLKIQRSSAILSNKVRILDLLLIPTIVAPGDFWNNPNYTSEFWLLHVIYADGAAMLYLRTRHLLNILDPDLTLEYLKIIPESTSDRLNLYGKTPERAYLELLLVYN